MSKSSPGLAACLLLAGLLAAAAQAQTPAPAAGADGDAIPPYNCPNPTLPSDKDNPDQKQIQRFNKDFPAYHACIQAYVEARKGQMNHYNELGKKEADAAKVAIDEINKVVADAKAFMPQDDDSDNNSGAARPNPGGYNGSPMH